MQAGGRLAFLSDHEGWGNLYSVNRGGGDLRRGRAELARQQRQDRLRRIKIDEGAIAGEPDGEVAGGEMSSFRCVHEASPSKLCNG